MKSGNVLGKLGGRPVVSLWWGIFRVDGLECSCVTRAVQRRPTLFLAGGSERMGRCGRAELVDSSGVGEG